jgi:hypothetical protein
VCIAANTYGSGYPSLRGGVVSQRDFPFYYRPVMWYDYDSGQTSHDPYNASEVRVPTSTSL